MVLQPPKGSDPLWTRQSLSLLGQSLGHGMTTPLRYLQLRQPSEFGLGAAWVLDFCVVVFLVSLSPMVVSFLDWHCIFPYNDRSCEISLEARRFLCPSFWGFALLFLSFLSLPNLEAGGYISGGTAKKKYPK
ncbi:hypothetical protein QBC39DRAFT_97910 [Podospora conica]|nr:hypothetical protein QBC39DRAFT_97910 [Schizothecium conicum]